jgi:hypothetical protein
VIAVSTWNTFLSDNVVSLLVLTAAGFQAVGIGFFGLIFLFDEKYLFRFPFDVYFMVIFYKHSGVPVEFIPFSSKKEIDIDEAWISGFFTSLNKIFRNLGKLDRNLEHLSGGGLHFSIEWGTKMGFLIIADKISYYLERALKKFSTDFEKSFKSNIQAGTIASEDFTNIPQIIHKHFPFLKIKEAFSE